MVRGNNFQVRVSIFWVASRGIYNILVRSNSSSQTIKARFRCHVWSPYPWRMLNILETAWKSEIENRNEYTITSVSIELRVSQSENKGAARKPNKNVKKISWLIIIIIIIIINVT